MLKNIKYSLLSMIIVFKHLFKKGNEHLIEEFQKEVDRRWEELLFRCSK